MTAVEVAKLTLRCESRERDRTRFAIEDGLRTAIPDVRRLTLLRRMQVDSGVASASPARRQEAVRDGWLAAVAGARHGGEDGAADANCVWFESREEAEAILLSRLLAGRPLDAWYWRLAVADWGGRPLRPWLDERLSRALASGDDRCVLAVSQACLAAGAADRLIDILAGSAPAPAVPPAPGGRSPSGGAPDVGTSAAGAPTSGPAPAPIAVASELRRALAGLIRAGGEGPAAARAILRAWAVRQSPALALASGLLAAVVARTLDEIGAPGPATAPPGPHSAFSPQDATARPSPRGPLPRPPAPASPRPRKAALRAPERGPAPEAPPAAIHGLAPAESPLGLAMGECRHSRHAGLWLVLPSLLQLGFREWLAERPDLLACHPGSLLLHSIADRHRIDPLDPVLAVLPPRPDDEPLPEWAGRWRHGLDRWLRRRARRRLHDLVNRPGALDWDEWRIDVRFPAADADIALRRLALDRDPGWTDWLGLSVRYRFGGPKDLL